MSGRPFTILGIVVALVALLAFIFVGGTRGATRVVTGNATQKSVVVAARDISIRVPITPADVTTIKIDETAIPPQAFTSVDQLKGLIPMVPIYKGQPVTGNVLVSSSDQVTGAQEAFLPIPKGFVAMTIPTGEQQGVAGFIQAGDYITIEAIVQTGGKFANTRTVFTNIHIIKLGAVTSDLNSVTPGAKPSPATKGAPTIASSLTVVVTQCQAEFINWFIANAAVKYTLESYKDYAPKDVAVDSTCPGVDSAQGVNAAAVAARWAGLLNP
ncbi:MAG: hypothetical protein NVS9B1_06300 [Candidatus Dormibacteraceae bacterium]